MTTSPRQGAIGAAVLALGIGTAALALEQSGTNGHDKIKAALLKPAAWAVEWIGPGGSGRAEYVYEARGQQIVVRIQQLFRSDGATLPKCEREVKINSDGVTHDGCIDYGITFVFDATDPDYQFRGKSPRGYEYKLKSK